MRVRGTKALALVGATTLALTACSDDGGGGGLSADASPAEVVAAGLEERFENGASFTFQLEGDLDAIAERVGEPAPPEAEALFNEGLISGAFHPEDGLAMTVGADGGFFEMRAVEEAMYLRLDLDALQQFAPEGSEIPSADVLLGQLQAFPLPPDVTALAEAAIGGQWVGITGITQQALTDFAETMGQPVPDQEQASEQQQAVRDVLEEQGLLDGTTLVERFLQVEGDGPTYAVTVMARELVTALNEVSAEVESALGPAAGGMSSDLPSTDEVPETLSGFAITVEDGAATALAADVAEVMESAGETGDIEAGDVVATLTLDDLGDQLAVPADATTIAFEELVGGVMGGLMGGMGG